MKLLTVMCLCFVYSFSFSQSAEVKLAHAFKKLESDSQFKHAIISLYVIDSKTGKVIFDKNSQLGLAPASSLKVFTSAAALELLGKSYRYKTIMAAEGFVVDSMIVGDLYFFVSGDPTLGSWRWAETKEEVTKHKISQSLLNFKIFRISGNIVFDDLKW